MNPNDFFRRRELSLCTFLYFGTAGILATFYYPFLQQKIGLDLLQISKITSFGAMFSLISQPLLGYLFVRCKQKKRFMQGYMLSLIGILMLMLIIGKEVIYPFAILYGSLVLPLIGTYEIYIEKVAVSQDFEYSKVRKWGSIGMGSITLLGGSIIGWFSFGTLHLLGMGFLILCIAILQKLNASIDNKDKKNKPITFKEVFSNSKVRIIYLMCFLGIGSYVGCDFAFSSYLTSLCQNVTLSNQLFSLSTGLKIFLEFVLFIVIGRYIHRITIKKAFLFIFIFSGLRFLCLSSKILPLVIAGDLLHCIVFPLFLTTIFMYLHHLVEDELVASCYSIVSVLMFGVSNFIFPMLFATIANHYGYSTMYRINVFLAILTFIIGILCLPNKPKTIEGTLC